MRLKRAACVAVFVLAAVPCMGNPVKYLVETFDGTLEEASWRAKTGDEIVATGGNPDAFLHVLPVATDTPSIATTGFPGIWTGPYRLMGVLDLGIDVQVLGDASTAIARGGDPASDDRPVSLVLINKGDDLDDPTDDCIVAQVGQKLPKPGAGWRSYGFHVQSDMTSLPSGWSSLASCGGRTADEVWNKVIGLVYEARFVIGDPGARYPVETWDVGFDNPRLQASKHDRTLTSIGIDPAN